MEDFKINDIGSLVFVLIIALVIIGIWVWLISEAVKSGIIKAHKAIEQEKMKNENK